jgi:hypothetical protein
VYYILELSISDLVYINDAAKSLKYSDFVFINNLLVGIDNINTYTSKVILDVNKLSNVSLIGLSFNQRELSKFVKSLSVESSFYIDENQPINKIYSSVGAVELNIHIDSAMNNLVAAKINQSLDIDNLMINSEDVTADMEKLFSMRKGDGAFYYVSHDNHYMTLFNGLLPLNKSDKIFLSIYDAGYGTFTTRFIVKKSKFTIMVYVSYLSIPKKGPQ